MEFFSYHGCLPQERLEGNTFLVDFFCEYDFSPALQSDALEDTLDYGEIYDIIAAQMAIPSNLLEHVAGRIVSAVSAAHPELEHFRVRISKVNPPVKGPAKFSSVTIEK